MTKKKNQKSVKKTVQEKTIQIAKYLLATVIGVLIGQITPDLYSSFKINHKNKQFTSTAFSRIEVKEIEEEKYQEAKEIILEKNGLSDNDIFSLDIYTTSLSNDNNEDLFFYLYLNNFDKEQMKAGIYGILIKTRDSYVLSYHKMRYIAEYNELIPFSHNNKKYVLDTSHAGSGNYLFSQILSLNKINNFTKFASLETLSNGGVSFTNDHLYLSSESKSYEVFMNNKTAKIKEVNISDYINEVDLSEHLLKIVSKRNMKIWKIVNRNTYLIYFDNKKIKLNHKKNNPNNTVFYNPHPIEIEQGDIIYIDTMQADGIFRYYSDDNLKFHTGLFDYITFNDSGKSNLFIHTYDGNECSIDFTIK